MHYALAIELLRVREQQRRDMDYGNATYTIQHTKWDDKFKVRLEKLWEGVVGDQKGKPGTFVAFDDSSKKIFFKGHVQQVHDFETMLKEIDIEIPQVRLDVRVIIADKNFEEMLGFQWSGRYDRKMASRRLEFASFGAKQTPVIEKDAGAAGSGTNPTVNTPFGVITDWSLNLIPGWKTNDTVNGFAKNSGMFSMPFIFRNADYTKLLNLTLNAAENRHEIKTILKPSLLVNSEETAEILVGESMPLQTMVAESVGSNISNVTTTQYKDLGIKVNVKPVVCPGNDSVFLDIFLENSSLTPLTTPITWSQPTSSGAGTQSIGYTIKTSRSKNRVLLHSGQTTLISGLIVNTRDTMKSGVPFLQDLPVLGWFFRGTKKSVEDKQLLIFITPMVM
jgi:type IV pilus assembly protein PilQ